MLNGNGRGVTDPNVEAEKAARLLEQLRIAFDNKIVLKYTDPHARDPKRKVIKVFVEERPESLDFSVTLARADNPSLLYHATKPHESLSGLPPLPPPTTDQQPTA